MLCHKKVCYLMGVRCCRYCYLKEGKDGVFREECNVCDARRAALAHPSSFLTDLNDPLNMTCWVSRPGLAGQLRNVSLTLSLGKKFELTYVICILKKDLNSLFSGMSPCSFARSCPSRWLCSSQLITARRGSPSSTTPHSVSRSTAGSQMSSLASIMSRYTVECKAAKLQIVT